MSINKKLQYIYKNGNFNDVNGVTPDEVNNAIEQAMEASKDIISQIKIEYDGETYTDIVFPKGVMPISITLNTNDLFLKDGAIVGRNGKEVEGYTYDDYYQQEDGSLSLSLEGDLSEQVINKLIYIPSNGSSIPRINNTYNLFYPKTGTKLYKHRLTGFSIEQSGQSITIIITMVSNNRTKITNAGMLSMLFDNVSINVRGVYQGSEKICFYKNFIPGPNLVYVYLGENVNSVSAGSYSLTNGTIADEVEEL